MDFQDEKTAFQKEIAGEAGLTDATTRVEPTIVHSKDYAAETLINENVLEKEIEKDAGTPDTRHLSVDLNIEERRKRESIESRLFNDTRDSLDSDLDETARQTGQAHLAAPVEVRPQRSRGATDASGVSLGSRRSMPPLRRKETKLAQKEAHPWQHLGITLGLPAILLFDIIVPCIIYYTWYNDAKGRWIRQCSEEYRGQHCPIPKPEYNKDILGYAIISFGFGELWILIARVWRLLFRTEECAPLLSRNRWELDATSWVYGVAMIMALIPFVIGASLEMPILYLYSPSFIMGFLGTLMAITTFVPITIPIGINSHPRGSRIRPFIYYAAEDFVAVDGLQDREFRVRYNERYETNATFRRFFLYLTLWWMLGVCVYIGCVSAVIFTLEFHYAFGLSLGVLFSYIAVWAGVTVVWVKIEMRREHRAYEEGEIDG